jgi:adenylate kinase
MSADAPPALNVLLFGPPGAGKRSQAQLLRDQYCICNLNMSALFRESVLRYNAVNSYNPPQRAPHMRPKSDVSHPDREKYHHRIHFLNEDCEVGVTPAQEKIANCVYVGGKIKDEDVVELLMEKVNSEECKKGYVIHGFPRTIEQVDLVRLICDCCIFFR